MFFEKKEPVFLATNLYLLTLRGWVAKRTLEVADEETNYRSILFLVEILFHLKKVELTIAFENQQEVAAELKRKKH